MARERSGRKSAGRKGGAGGRPAARGGEAPGIEPGVFTIDSGTAEILRDPFTDGAWLLKLNGAESSQLNLDDPLDLGFEYMRWIAAVIRHRWAPEEPLRILHLGAAGCTLARWAAAWYPDSRQTAVELDAGLAALARDRFALPRAPRLRIRVGEAGEVLAGAHEHSRDVIVRDVFAGTTPEDQVTPDHLIGLDAARHARRVLGADGIYLVNHGGGPDLTAARREAATLSAVFGTVVAIADPQMLKGRRRGNIVFAATDGRLTARDGGGALSRDGLVRHLLADPLPARLVDPVTDFAAGARPLAEPLPGTKLGPSSARVNDDNGENDRSPS
ncbi:MULTISPECIES: spermidine synthase [Citricoccus]|uniref:spermidine synthase n=1 Tax=Citricoccus TaxID=169133 RepID=UPI000255DFA5|nr:fused MFS/spermidine synthase [Citricoccus sp. CH26A]